MRKLKKQDNFWKRKKKVKKRWQENVEFRVKSTNRLVGRWETSLVRGGNHKRGFPLRGACPYRSNTESNPSIFMTYLSGPKFPAFMPRLQAMRSNFFGLTVFSMLAAYHSSNVITELPYRTSYHLSSDVLEQVCSWDMNALHVWVTLPSRALSWLLRGFHVGRILLVNVSLFENTYRLPICKTALK